MPKIIEAVYENGVFKPLEKVDLKEGEKVRLRVEKNLYDVILRYREYFEDVDEDLTTELVRERR
ncbi:MULTISPECIES: antitoxin family protein [unclassified Archaeoglobus]|jgi:predicted DNA-binding antitoxin AbrB/MazE fold protein|uniref:antitoxin family protein n=1 Tax=unclassified Archaeoglobus TaxID=2643606 RepID=UPI0025BAD10A|nr:MULTISPECIES: antitoxin family protein [unclassified Archaeoglobus]